MIIERAPAVTSKPEALSAIRSTIITTPLAEKQLQPRFPDPGRIRSSWMPYVEFIRFLLPLVLAVVVEELGRQFLNAGMARVPRPTETLAGFGLAWGLTNLLTSSLSQVRQLGLVLVDSDQALKKVHRFVLGCGLLLAGLLAALALGPPGVWVIEELHGVTGPFGIMVRQALFWFIPLPVLIGLARLYSGLLLRVQRTDVVSGAGLAGIGASILAVLALLPAGFVQVQPMRLPVMVTYAGVLADLGIVFWGYRRYARPSLGHTAGELTISYVARFFWPLALIMAIQGLSRPLVNLFVSRGPDGTEALAVLTVVYALGHIPYGWLNEIRNLPPAFKGKDDSLTYIRRFAAGCGLLSFAIMLVLFWTPLRVYILETLIGLQAELAGLCKMPLFIFSFFPLVVMVRAYLHGVGLLEHRTGAMAPSAPSRIGIIFVALVILSATGLPGATRGIAALLSGFVLETVVVWWGVRGRKRRR